MRKKIHIIISEDTDDGMKVSIGMEEFPFKFLDDKFRKGEKMTLLEVSAHYMLSKYIEYHQQRALLTVQHQEAKPGWRKNFFGRN